jgi:fumarate reductase subunit D
VNPIHRLEPIWWLLFGAGGFATALFLPGLLLGFSLGTPLGWWSDYAVSYHRVRALVANPIGGPLIALLLSLMAWHSAHHLRHFALDIGWKRLEMPISIALYGLAAVTTLASFAAVARLLA